MALLRRSVKAGSLPHMASWDGACATTIARKGWHGCERAPSDMTPMRCTALGFEETLRMDLSSSGAELKGYEQFWDNDRTVAANSIRCIDVYLTVTHRARVASLQTIAARHSPRWCCADWTSGVRDQGRRVCVAPLRTALGEEDSSLTIGTADRRCSL